MTTASELEGAIRRSVGEPSVGAVADALPAIIEAALRATGLAPDAETEAKSKTTRVVKATEER
jgi:hypothetical protein